MPGIQDFQDGKWFFFDDDDGDNNNNNNNDTWKKNPFIQPIIWFISKTFANCFHLLIVIDIEWNIHSDFVCMCE